MYIIDLKIYEQINMYEIPFSLPESMIKDDGTLKIGTHTIATHCSEEQMDEFTNWVSKHGQILKILGTTKA